MVDRETIEQHIEAEFSNIADRPRAQHSKELRATRRAIAINAVTTARMHAGRGEDVYSQSDADVIMAIIELLDRVAGNGV